MIYALLLRPSDRYFAFRHNLLTSRLNFRRLSEFNLSFAVIINELPGDNYFLAVECLHVREFREVRIPQHRRQRGPVVRVKIEYDQVPVALLKQFADSPFERSLLPN